MRNHSTVLIILVAVVALAGCSSPEPESQEVWQPRERVETAVGPLRGVADDGVMRYRGVPYAEPPVGDRRFSPPEPIAGWKGTLDATRSGPTCPQPGAPGAAPSTDEDCLTLDVTAPAESGRDRPVMVWLHGGGFDQGRGSDYDPRRMVTRGDVVVVSVESRLGVLGYLGAPGLPDGGTFGLADQQAALRFVKQNARAFGGDPENVTLFGESGGATSTCYQLTSPGARGLFDRAILQSPVNCGAPAPAAAYGPIPGRTGDLGGGLTVADVERQGVDAARRLGCPTSPEEAVVACLRGLPVERLLSVHLEFASPAIGGSVLPEEPRDVLDEVSVPVLAGFNRDESRYFAATAALIGSPIEPGSYERLLRTSFGDEVGAVLTEYPRERYATDAEAWAAVMTDRTFACAQLSANDDLARRGEVHAYEFADRTVPAPIPFLPGTGESGAPHAAELSYLFDVANQPLDLNGKRIPLTPAQREVAGQMIDAWTGFARDGNPGGPTWDGKEPASLTFGADGTSVTDPARTHRCEFWADRL